MGHDVDFERILTAWATRVRESLDEPRSNELLEAYRELGRVVLDETLDADSRETGRRGAASDDGRRVERARSGVAAAIRREELTVSRALRDLRLLVSAVLSELEVGAADPAASQTALRVSEVLDRSLISIVQTVEAAATRAAREQSESLAAFTDQLSHELENRLGAARTAGQMLRPAGIDLENVDLGRVGELVEASIEAALKTVQDVRDLVVRRVDPSGRDVRTMALPRLIRSVIDELGPTAFAAGVDVTVGDDILDCRVDGARFRLIVYNLVGNGIKYRDPDEVAPFVRVETDLLPDGHAALRIIDNGIGIPAEEIDDIFLLRSRGGGARDVPGTGLGLAIVGEAVDQIGGRIDVTSEVGAGTTFTVTFRPTNPTGED